MRPIVSDTSPEAHRVHIELVRKTPGWRRLQLALQSSQMVRELVLVGVRSRHPEASETEIKIRFADLQLGPDLAEEVFGPLELGSP